jgi:hypothetical protein
MSQLESPAAGADRTKAPAVPVPTYEGDFVLDESLLLESGDVLVKPTLHYAVYGRLNARRDNAVLVCHALSGSAQVGTWWPELFTPGGLLSVETDYVLCINLFGSCYGSCTGPIFRWFRFETMSAHRRGCWSRWASGGCGWFSEGRSAACRRLNGQSCSPNGWSALPLLPSPRSRPWGWL